MAISDVLLKGALTFKTFLDKGEEGLKSEDFRGGRHLWMAPHHKLISTILKSGGFKGKLKYIYIYIYII